MIASAELSRTAPVPTRLTGDRFAVVTRGLVKRYGRETALAGVDLQAAEGAVYVLAGANGAGRSTLLRTLLNLTAPDAGEAEVLGLDPRAQGPLVRARVGYVPKLTEAGYRWMIVGRLLRQQATYGLPAPWPL